MFAAKRLAGFIITVLNFITLCESSFRLSFIAYRAPQMSLLCWNKSYLEPLFRTVHLNGEIKYTNVTCSTSYFEKISLQLGCQCNWSESCFGSIFRTDCL